MCEFGVTVTRTSESEAAGTMILSDILRNMDRGSRQVYCYLTPLTPGIISYPDLSSEFLVTDHSSLYVLFVQHFFHSFFLLIVFARSSRHRILLCPFFEELCVAVASPLGRYL